MEEYLLIKAREVKINSKKWTLKTKYLSEIAN